MPKKRAGRPPSGAAQGRAWFRSIVDDPERQAAYIRAVDAQLAAGDTRGFEKAVEHGYGRAPQSLTVSQRYTDQDKFVATFADGTSVDSIDSTH